MYKDLSPLILLDNGLKLMLHYHPELPGIHIRANVKMGSCDEPLPRDKGICNLIEKICWRGSDKMSTKKVSEVASIGGRFSGGSVHRALTTYHTWCPNDQFHKGLDLLDNIIFRPRMDAADLDLEKRLAIMRITADDCDPVTHATQMALRNLYPKHRVAFGMLGTPETVTNMKVTRMRELVRGSHRPQAMILGLSGNLPPLDQLEGILSRHAGGFVEKTRAANAIPLDRNWGDATIGESTRHQEIWGYQGDWTNVFLFPVPADVLREDGLIVLSIICKLVGSGINSLLWQKMISGPKPTAHDVAADFEWLDGIAWVRIIIRSSGERDIDIPATLDYIEGHMVSHIKDEQIEQARVAVHADMTVASTDPVAKLATDMEWLSLDTARWSPDLDLPWIGSVDFDDIRSTLDAIFIGGVHSVFSISR